MKLLRPLGNPSRLLIGLLAVSSLSLATPIIFDRGLPSSSSANDPSSAARSNVDWANQNFPTGGGRSILGDNFTLGVSSTGTWFIDTISIWTVLNTVGHTPSDEFSGFTLYGGLESSPGTFGVISTSASVSRDHYIPTPGVQCLDGVLGENYLSKDGVTCLPIYKVTFLVSLALPSSSVYDFAADATPIGGNLFLSHATNAALAVNPQPGANNLYFDWDTLALTAGHGTDNSNPSCVPAADTCGGWDKSSDINVQVTGSTVPEPSTLGMLGLGLAAVIATIRRRRG